MKISTNTLRAHYAWELENARKHFIAAVGQVAGQMALGRAAEWSAPDKDGKRILLKEELKPDGAMVRYVLSSIAKDLGWGEKLQLSGDRNNPIQFDYGNLTDEQLATLLAAIESRINNLEGPENGPRGTTH